MTVAPRVWPLRSICRAHRLTLLRLAVAATVPLAPDEAYYWVWSHAWPPATRTIRRWSRCGSELAP